MTTSYDTATIERAAEIIRRGGLVAYPTDTVYGLAVDPTNDEAVQRLFEAKDRTADHAVPLLIADAAEADAYVAHVGDFARRLMDAFWPGALAIVLVKAQTFSSIAVGETVALRVPDHPVPRQLARELGRPITGTSANRSGRLEALTADEVRSQLGDRVDLVIDGGRCPGGTPSTVIDCTTEPPRILRDGAISREELERVVRIAPGA